MRRIVNRIFCVHSYIYHRFHSCLGMLHYALMIENSTIAMVNGFGLLLQCGYVICFLLIVKSKVCGKLLHVTVDEYESNINLDFIFHE